MVQAWNYCKNLHHNQIDAASLKTKHTQKLHFTGELLSSKQTRVGVGAICIENYLQSNFYVNLILHKTTEFPGLKVKALQTKPEQVHLEIAGVQKSAERPPEAP